MGSIIMLCGPPGAGKTTAAKKLAALLDGPVANIEGDKFWSFIVKGAEGADELEAYRLNMRATFVAAMPYAGAGYSVIADFGFSPKFIPGALKLAKARNIAVHFVVIRPDIEVCALRAGLRDEGRIADYAGYERFYHAFDTVPQYTIYDNSGNADIIASKIKEGLGQGMFLISD